MNSPDFKWSPKWPDLQHFTAALTAAGPRGMRFADFVADLKPHEKPEGIRMSPLAMVNISRALLAGGYATSERGTYYATKKTAPRAAISAGWSALAIHAAMTEAGHDDDAIATVLALLDRMPAPTTPARAAEPATYAETTHETLRALLVLPSAPADITEDAMTADDWRGQATLAGMDLAEFDRIMADDLPALLEGVAVIDAGTVPRYHLPLAGAEPAPALASIDDDDGPPMD